ncbi:hypothetical protein PIB30_001180 [Stylosanthes scabra]|uniref:Pectinesterase n=1 Tax=Stylosanthes scabra TaxID=79078 RepID=A0ABU6V5T3_9FABA|nr:hypothetical protein [Stylosanthes scabra]
MGKTFLTLLLLSSIFTIAASRKRSSSSNEKSNIDWWCNRTPHPAPCKFYMRQSHYNPYHRLKHRTDFRSILLNLALDQALLMQQHAHSLQNSNTTMKQQTVFQDCLKLYDNTVFHLNRTIQGLRYHQTRNCSAFDGQTWLSTALTNIVTCKKWANAMKIQGLTDSSLPGINVSEIISNTLAVNSVFLKYQKNLLTEDYSAEAFPSWFSATDRRLLQSSGVKANLVVAKDGSGHFKTVQAAIDAAAKRRSKTRFVIHVKKGVYRENIEVDKTNDNIMLVGDGMRNTIIASGRSVQQGYTTYSSATAGIDGPHFIARDICFINTAGPLKGQAVALRSASDLSVFYRCSIIGYQDTLMAHAQRQFYRGCYIYGTVDFIFGNAAVVFQNCVILVRKPNNGQANMITAQGRGDPFQNTGISFHNCQIRAAPDLKPVVNKYNTFLGRPWQQYSRVVVMKTYIDSLVSPMGWSPWGNTNFAQSTLYYGEYKNFGPGSSTKNRVRWPGYHVLTSPAQATPFTVNSLLAGGTWLPATGVPFTAGL